MCRSYIRSMCSQAFPIPAGGQRRIFSHRASTHGWTTIYLLHSFILLPMHRLGAAYLTCVMYFENASQADKRTSRSRTRRRARPKARGRIYEWMPSIRYPKTIQMENQTAARMTAQHNYNTKELKHIYNVYTMAHHRKKSRGENHPVDPAARRGVKSDMRRVGRRKY